MVDNKPVSLETRMKMSEAHKGEKNHFFGKTHSEENRMRMSLAASKRTQEKNAHWKGGRYPTTAGYILAYQPNHPNTGCKGYVREHRLVYEQYHKCSILPWVDVHHIDRNKQNNDISNLMLISPVEHGRIHHKKGQYR